MNSVAAKLNARDKELLISLIGKKIFSFICNPLSKHNMVFGNVRLIFDNHQIEVNNKLTALDVGGVDDFGVLYVTSENGPFIPRIKADEVLIREIHSNVSNIKIVTDTIICMNESKELYTAEFDVAIVFELENRMVIIKKDIWYEEFLVIHTSNDSMKKLNPTDHGWKFNEPYHGIFKRKIKSIKRNSL